MNKVLDIVRSEPVRTLLYPVLVVVIGALVAKGAVSDFSADTIVALVAAVLGVPAAEIARKNVWPDSKISQTADSGERE